MSCFVVGVSCIDDVVTLLNTYIKEYKDMDKTAFGKKLFDMNCDAYAQRYDEDSFEYEYNYHMSDKHELSMFYNLCALIYNCSEGTVVNNALFKKLRKHEDFFIRKFYDKYISSNRKQLGINMKMKDLYHYMFDKIVEYMHKNNIELSWGE